LRKLKIENFFLPFPSLFLISKKKDI